MVLKYLTEGAYEALFQSIDRNKEKYLDDKMTWLKDFFPLSDFSAQSQISAVGSFKPINMSPSQGESEKSSNDFENTKRMFIAASNLTPLQASNKYMWTYLCHFEPSYTEYIKSRWTDIRTNTIKTRYFVTSSKTSLFDNALSRLWWYGYLTYDDNASDPYHLTKILLTNQTICTDFIDTFNAENHDRMKGVLSALAQFNDSKDSTENLIRSFRSCNKYLNRYAAVTNLDFLSWEEIRELVLSFL